jgi:hypothetical protein
MLRSPADSAHEVRAAPYRVPGLGIYMLRSPLAQRTRRHELRVHEVQLVIQRQDLDRAERVEQMRVVALAAAEAAAWVRAAEHPVHDGAGVKDVQSV